MSECYRSRLVAGLMALSAFPAMVLGADPPKEFGKAQAKPPRASLPVELTVSPAPEPVPALRYRLFPLASERNPGDAAPIYLRIGLEISEAANQEIERNYDAWVSDGLPIDKLPEAEVRRFLDLWRGRLQQLAFGARRQSCHWNYSLPEQREHAIEILLPDAQGMRRWARLLAIQARLEIAERRYTDATRTIETGLAFSRHVAGGPFVINALIGTGCASVMFDRIDELIAQPDAPNLYWSLTALPRPFLPMRDALENEQKMGEWLIPELDDLDRPRSESEWTALAGRLHARLIKLDLEAFMSDGRPRPVVPKFSLVQFREEGLKKAREYFAKQAPRGADMTDSQMLVLYLAEAYRALRDDAFKHAYLPFSEATPFRDEATRRVESVKEGPLAILAALFPNMAAIEAAEARTDRKVAALRVVEAIRLHAARQGTLPASLGEVRAVPIPPDPVTHRPFDYRREGGTAILSGPPPLPNQPGLTYRIALRK